MKLLDNYLDHYYLRKLLRETLDWLFVFYIDTKCEIEKLGNGHKVLRIYVKLKEENDEQYQVVSVTSSSKALMCLLDKEYFKRVQEYTKKVLKDKHAKLGGNNA